MISPLYEVGADLFAPLPSKKQRRMLQMIEAAITSYATLGVDGTTYESVATLCGVTPPLVHNYFKSKKKLLEMAARYIRLNMQKMAIAAIAVETEPDRQLDAYVRSVFEWLERYPSHALVWYLFLYQCGFEKGFRKTNGEFVAQGRARLTALLAAGAERGQFHPQDFVQAATAIQVHLTGALVTVESEGLPVAPFRERSLAICRLLAGAVTAPAPAPKGKKSRGPARRSAR